jgi:hypothetical protein
MMLTAGCSIAHGQGTIIDQYDKNNYRYSYPNLIAQLLGINCDNFSIPAASNEFIFHSIIENLYFKNYTHCLVAWTALGRDAWSSGNEIWCANLHHAAYLNLDKPIDLFVEDKAVSNDPIMLQKLLKYHEALPIKLASDDQLRKLKHYSSLITEICRVKNINLVQVSSLTNGLNCHLITQSLMASREKNSTHPNKIAHQYWANEIYQKFYDK